MSTGLPDVPDSHSVLEYLPFTPNITLGLGHHLPSSWRSRVSNEVRNVYNAADQRQSRALRDEQRVWLQQLVQCSRIYLYVGETGPPLLSGSWRK